ncbi:MAG: ABC transporter permease [Fimbriimonas sp.]
MSPVLQVFRKETREMFRDKRVRSAAFIGPIVLIVMVTMLFGFVFGSIGKKENQKVHVVKTDAPEAVALRSTGIQVIEVPDVKAGEELIKKSQARLVLDFQKAGPDGQTRVDAYLDPKSQPGQIALGTVQAYFGGLNRQSLGAVLQERGIPASVQEKIKIERKEVAIGEKGGASDFIVGMLPYLIVIWAFYGAMSIAGDLVAGEKEKNTLETLLITPTRRTDIVLGKFLALGLVSLLSSLSSLVGLAGVAILKLPGADIMFKGGTGLSPTAALIIILVMLPLVALFSAILVAVSSYARNPREAQTYLTQVSFIVIMPAMFSQFIGFLDAGSAFWVNFVPILNAANNMRLALLGKPDFVGAAATVAISLVLAIGALYFTVKLFNREEVLVRV